MPELSLTEALRTGRIKEFSEQAEARLRELGFDDPAHADVEAELAKVIRLQSEGQTSRSPSRGGSTEN